MQVFATQVLRVKKSKFVEHEEDSIYKSYRQTFFRQLWKKNRLCKSTGKSEISKKKSLAQILPTVLSPYSFKIKQK